MPRVIVIFVCSSKAFMPSPMHELNQALPEHSSPFTPLVSVQRWKLFKKLV